MSDAAIPIGEVEVLPALVHEAVPERRKVGRPKGSRNRSLVTEKRIRQHNNARSFLDKVVKGGKIKAAEKTGGRTREWCYPTVTERLKAADVQLRDAGAVQAVQAAEAGVQMGPAAIINIQINAPA